MSSRGWIVLGIGLHLAFQLAPAWKKVSSTPSGRDFASYYYATQAAADGADPYDTAALSKAARNDHTRRVVNPYFYPPPFLYSVAWSLPMTLPSATIVMLGLNEALLAGCLALMHFSFGVAPWALALLLATYTPIPDNAWMGQANLLALFPALAGLALARRPVISGVLVGIAGMFKMSPALYLLWFALRRNVRAFAVAGLTAIALTLLSLPLVGPDAQVRFYTQVLPGFLAGDYHDLTVPISLPANHSIPDLYNYLWPGPHPTRLSVTAAWASRITGLALLGAWAWRFRHQGEERRALGALTVLMVILPAYTYEHHLVFLLPAVGVAASGIRGVGSAVVFGVSYFLLAWPLEWLRATQGFVGAHGGGVVAEIGLRESKFLAEVGILGLLTVSSDSPSPTTSATARSS